MEVFVHFAINIKTLERFVSNFEWMCTSFKDDFDDMYLITLSSFEYGDEMMMFIQELAMLKANVVGNSLKDIGMRNNANLRLAFRSD